MAFIVAENGARKKVRCFLDNGSNVSIVLKSVADQLAMLGPNVDLGMSTTGQNFCRFRYQRVVNFRLASLDGTYITNFKIEASTAPVIARDIPKMELDPKELEYLDGIEFTENFPMSEAQYNNTKQISVMVGLPFEARLVKRVPLHPPDGPGGPNLQSPSVIFTYLGNALTSDTTASLSHNTTFHTLQDDKCEQCEDCAIQAPDMTNFLTLDNIGIKDPMIHTELTFEEYQAQKIIEDGTTYCNVTKTYTTVLPWISTPIQEDNKKVALAAASRWVKKYCDDDEKWSQLCQAYKSSMDFGFLELVPYNDMQKTKNYHYIQTFPVWQPQSLSTPCRVVYQANAKMPISKKSINDHLFKGTNYLPEVPHQILKFRQNKIQAVTDISKMYNRLALQESEKDYLRIFCSLEKPNENGRVPLKSYRCTSLPFGLVCSGYVASHILMKIHAKKYEKTHLKKAAEFIASSTYCDDTTYGGDSPDSVKLLTSQIKQIFDDCSFPSHKYSSNSAEALMDLDPSLICTKKIIKVLGSFWNTEQDSLTFKYFEAPGYALDMDDDEKDKLILQDSEEIDKTIYTKRQLASQLAKLYDSCGLISPLILRGKLILQTSWLLKMDWDEKFPPEVNEEVRTFYKSLPKLHEVTIPRSFMPSVGTGTVVEIMTLCDASSRAFGCATYVITEDQEGGRISNLAFAKSKVRPLNKRFSALSEDLSICRLELLSCDIGARAGNYVREAFPPHLPIKMSFFTDSQVSLHRLSKDYKNYRVFVANRIKNVQMMTDVNHDWYFVKGEDNFAADACSRSKTLDEFFNHPEWLYGPPWATNPSFKRTTLDEIKINQEAKRLDQEEKNVSLPRFHHTVLEFDNIDPNFFESQVAEEASQLGLLQKRESWYATTHILAWILKFTKNVLEKARSVIIARKNSQPRPFPKISKIKYKLKMSEEDKAILNNEILAIEEVHEAEHKIWKYSQWLAFRQEIEWLKNEQELPKSSKLFKLMPYICEDGFLRMSSRLNFDPIILPETIVDKYGNVKKHIESKMYCRHVHKIHNHSSVSHTLYQMQKRVVVLGSRRQIRKSLMKCECREPIKLFQRMSKLPGAKYMEVGNHTHIMVDHAGPFYYKNKCHGKAGTGEECETNGELKKCWALLITCLHSRYLTIKLLKSCSTEDLLLGIRSYVANRGIWKVCYSDQSTTFKRGSKELRQIMSNIDWSQVKQLASRYEATWEFGTPLSPWRQGSIESLVNCCKSGLHKAIRNDLLDYDNLSVVFEEVSMSVNSRPLSYVPSSSPNQEDEMVSPELLVHGRRLHHFPIEAKPKLDKAKSNRIREIYRQRQKMLSHFWRIYFDTYFSQLHFTPKWYKKLSFDVQPGTYVLVKDDNMKKNVYKTGRVIRSIRGRDGCVRSLEIQTAENKNSIVRPIQRCSLMEHEYMQSENPNAGHDCSSSYTCIFSPRFHSLSECLDRNNCFSHQCHSK